MPSSEWKPKLRTDNVTKEYVPYMSYDEWYKEKIINDPTFIVQETKYKNKYSNKKQYLKYKEVIGKEIPKSFDKFQELKYNNVKEWENTKAR